MSESTEQYRTRRVQISKQETPVARNLKKKGYLEML